MRLTIELKSLDELNFIKQLLLKLGILVVTEEKVSSPNQKIAFEALQKIADRGVVTDLIQDPIAWQKETRQDRELPFRK